MSISSKVLVGRMAGKHIGDGLVVLPGQGNSLAAVTENGVVVLDASTARHVPAMLEVLRGVTAEPVHAIVYSHGHMGYNAAVDLWDRHNAERGDPPPRRIAHRSIQARYARYRETLELQARFAAMQFPGRVSVRERQAQMTLHDPSEFFDDKMTVVGGSRRIEVIWAPSEVEDALAVWLPDDGLLCGGPAVAGGIPNIGTPLRSQRFTRRWAETLQRLAGLGAERLLTEFAELVVGGDAVRERLLATSRALLWLRAEVLARLNKGMGELEILADIDYPDKLFGQPWMRPNYGSPDYIVRDIYREETGWWDRNPTTLHPAPPGEVSAALTSAIPDKAAVLARAQALAAEGRTQLALHVVDLVALGADDDPDVGRARKLKAELCRRRAEEVQPYVSKALYHSSAQLLDEGQLSWQHLA